MARSRYTKSSSAMTLTMTVSIYPPTTSRKAPCTKRPTGKTRWLLLWRSSHSYA